MIFLLWFSQIAVVKVVVCLLYSQAEEMVLPFESSEECSGIAESLVAAALGNTAWYLGSTVTFVTSARRSEGNLAGAGVGSCQGGQEHCKVLGAQSGPVSRMPTSRSTSVGPYVWKQISFVSAGAESPECFSQS